MSYTDLPESTIAAHVQASERKAYARWRLASFTGAGAGEMGAGYFAEMRAWQALMPDRADLISKIYCRNVCAIGSHARTSIASGGSLMSH